MDYYLFREISRSVHVYIGLVDVYPQESFTFRCHTGGGGDGGERACGSSTVSNTLGFSLAFVLRASRPFLAITTLHPEFFDLLLQMQAMRCRDTARLRTHVCVCARKKGDLLYASRSLQSDKFSKKKEKLRP
jgi:hypothetical protein